MIRKQNHNKKIFRCDTGLEKNKNGKNYVSYFHKLLILLLVA